MKDKRKPQEASDLLDDDLLNLDEFPEDLPDILGSPEDEPVSSPKTAKEQKHLSEPDSPVQQTNTDSDQELRMVGLVYKKAPGRDPEVNVVEAPVVPTEDSHVESGASSPKSEESSYSSGEEEIAQDYTPTENVSAGMNSSEAEEDEDLPPAWIWEKNRQNISEEETEAPEEIEPEIHEEKPGEEAVSSTSTQSVTSHRKNKHHKKKKKSASGRKQKEQQISAEENDSADIHLVEEEESPDDEDSESWGELAEESEESRKRTPLFRRKLKPDISPRQLAVIYGNRLSTRKRGLIISLILLIPLIYLNLSSSLNLPIPEFLWDDTYLTAAMLELLGIVILLLGGPFVKGFSDLFHGKPGLHTLCSLAVLLTALDGFELILIGREGPLPCISGAALILICSGAGQYLNQKAQRLSCRTAAMTSNPGRLTLLQEDGQPTDMLLKYKGDDHKFGSQIQASDGVQRRTMPLTLVVLILGILLSILASFGQDEPESVFWCASVIFMLASPLSATLAYGLPWSRVSERLNRVGAALAGWDGVLALKEANLIAVTDDDFFPTGMISCNGIQFYGTAQSTIVVGYAATLVKAAGGGLTDTFDKLVYSQGAKYWDSSLLAIEVHEDGGYSGQIGADEVLLGTAEFMEHMEIPLPEGISVKTAAFCAINGELVAQFALVYKMPSYVQPAVQALTRGKYQLVVASRDFNITPKLLFRSFNIPVQDLQYPNIRVRTQLSKVPEDESPVLGALLGREGLDCHCDAVLAAKTFYKVVKQNSRWAIFSTIVGLLLGVYLTMEQAFTALQPLNILVYLALWLVPCLLNSYKATRF